ncbi:exosortase K [Pedobacter sp. ok626]|uniref:exosortase K n=1 Tax=Pedobacter sp. ok626 TaxID=1761882 RepID=UPI0008889F93|nr:exosortase K [Pedobacter sp. ok626]
MDFKKNTFHYILGILLFGIFKIAYTQMDANDLFFILLPTDKIISVLTNSPGTFLNDLGFLHQDLNILIEKSCSGFNFLILSFIIGYFISLNHFHNRGGKYLLIPLSLLLSWILTLFVNTSRIIIAILLNKLIKPQLQVGPWLHQAEGTFVYLFFLILFYKTQNYLLTKYSPINEKLA